MNVKIEGNTLIITVDISAEAFANAQPSASGKTVVVDSSHGFTNYNTPNGMVGLSLNVTSKSKAAAAPAEFKSETTLIKKVA